MPFRHTLQSWDVEGLLRCQPHLTITPDDRCALLLTGRIEFTASGTNTEIITDAYEVAIHLPSDFPRGIPAVRDLSGRIKRNYHRLDDGSFCLGSPARLRLALVQSPTLRKFVEKCVIPYLYGYSFFEKYGRPPFGELAHGDQGLLDDYARLFGVSSIVASAGILKMMGMKRRVANKYLCPCGSHFKLGKCHNKVVNLLRPQLGRAWCRLQAQYLVEEYGDTLNTRNNNVRHNTPLMRARRSRKDSDRSKTGVESVAEVLKLTDEFASAQGSDLHLQKVA
jgi:hypothetical protein